MPGRDLKNKPLVEAILEVKWALQSQPPDLVVDPHYQLLVGRLFDRVSDDYPEHEKLPSAAIPDELTGHVVKHRFRLAPGDWPLIQIGPGILTVNDTQKYTWDDFRDRSVSAVEKLLEAHPKPDALNVTSLVLRYIDAVEMDFAQESIWDFLRDKMRVCVALPASLFDQTGIRSDARHFRWETSFACSEPSGVVNLRFATGQRDGKNSLIWETSIHSETDLPELPADFAGWIDAAHRVTDDWFFKLIEGELERSFAGE